MSIAKSVAAVLGLFLLVLLVWGVAVEPRLLDTEEAEVPIPGLPAAWEGQRVAVFGDIQVGMWWANTDTAREAVEAILEARPALALFVGDFVYKPDSAVVREAVEILRPLGASGIPTYAVLGNHDYSLYDKQSQPNAALVAYLEALVEEAGIPVLKNEAVSVEAPGGGAPLWVVGVGSEWAGNAHPERALAGVPAGAPRLMMVHNPTTYPRVPARAAPLAVAGHTHGGQIRLPFTPHTSWMGIVGKDDLIVDAWASDSVGAPGNRLYVNRGIGFSVVPARINCRPELTLFTLRRGPAQAGAPQAAGG
ncbi:MAG: metallophosphoesterase [Rubricoccaceae bacterium]|nr:metallophosphoesterase [Rubricoccaceae bacterium]